MSAPDRSTTLPTGTRAEEASVEGSSAPRSWSTPPPPSVEPPPVVVGYALGRLLGWGAHGVVWEAAPRGGGAPVALKVLRGAVSSQASEALRREASVLESLRIPGVARVLGWGETVELRPYCALELVEGRDLASLLREGEVAEGRAAGIGRRIAEVLAATHASGVAHCDLKPGNVMVGDDGSVVLLDFGLAAVAGAHSLDSAALRGSPAYMAPEQLAGAAPGPAADVHALGVLLYEMITGARPYQGEAVHQLLFQIAFAPPPRPRARAPRVSEEMERVCLSCLAKQPEERPHAADLVRALALLEQ